MPTCSSRNIPCPVKFVFKVVQTFNLVVFLFLTHTFCLFLSLSLSFSLSLSLCHCLSFIFCQIMFTMIFDSQFLKVLSPSSFFFTSPKQFRVEFCFVLCCWFNVPLRCHQTVGRVFVTAGSFSFPRAVFEQQRHNSGNETIATKIICQN